LLPSGPEPSVFSVAAEKRKNYNTQEISPMVLYGCETWFPTLRAEHRLGVFESRVLRRISGPKRDEVAREYRKLHNEELHDLYSSPIINGMVKSRRIRWAGNVARMGRKGMRIGCWWEN
jgi:hypothetical protein